MPSFAQTFKSVSFSSTLTNWNTKLLKTICWFYISLMCFLWHNKLLFIHSIKMKYDFINNVKNVEICAHISWDFAQNFDKPKVLVVRLHPFTSSSYNTVYPRHASIYHRTNKFVCKPWQEQAWMECFGKGDGTAFREFSSQDAMPFQKRGITGQIQKILEPTLYMKQCAGIDFLQ